MTNYLLVAYLIIGIALIPAYLILKNAKIVKN